MNNKTVLDIFFFLYSCNQHENFENKKIQNRDNDGILNEKLDASAVLGCGVKF